MLNIVICGKNIDRQKRVQQIFGTVGERRSIEWHILSSIM